MLQRRISSSYEDRDVEQGCDNSSSRGYHETPPRAQPLDAWVEVRPNSCRNGDTATNGHIPPSSETYDIYNTSDKQWILENGNEVENGRRPQTWFGYSSTPSGNTFVPSRHSVPDGTCLENYSTCLSRDTSRSTWCESRVLSVEEENSSWRLYCRGCAVIAIITAFISRIIARITGKSGSDPSLASGHQSCSVSKRTLHSTEPSRIPADPSRTNPMVLPDPSAVPTAGTGTTLHHDNHQYSYLGLSVSVGGYPKYRPFKNQELSKQSEDILNANKPSTNTSTQQQQQQNSSRPSSQPEFSVVNENSDMKSENLPNMLNGNSVVNGTNVNHSAVDGDDSVFVSKVIQDSSRIESEMKIQVTQTKKSEKTKPNLRVAINGTPEVMSVVGGPGSPGAVGEGGVHEVPPLTPRTRELRRGSVAKGGHFYLARVAEETARIRHFVAVCEADQAEPGKTEEVYGKLRAAAGKANLLVSQKFKQFIGLCEDNLHPDESKDENHETTNEDLAGFWDMMTIQIEDVDAAFADIQLMRENNWQEIQPPPVYRSLSTSSQKESTPEKPKRTPKKTAPASKTAKTRNDQKSRDEARKRLMEAKRLARRKRLTSGGSIDDVEIYIAEPEHKPTA